MEDISLTAFQFNVTEEPKSIYLSFPVLQGGRR